MESLGARARTNRLVTRDLGDELLVYDLDRHKAYCLNRVAMQVFRHCDGQTTIPDMARRIGGALGMPVNEETVRLGLARLEKARLLEEDAAGQTVHASRRDMLRMLGRAAVVALPLVTAISVPPAAHAASCFCRGVVTGGACGGCTGTCGKSCSRACVAGGFCGK